MKRPAFQFYPGDWQRNANLRRCSPAARGVWVDIMCLLHDSDEYGVLRWPVKEIAQACGASMAHVKELIEKSVLKGSDKSLEAPYIYTPRSGRKDGAPVTLLRPQAGPIWYSSRMVKDEYVRAHAGASTRFGSKSDADDESPATKANTVSDRARLRQRVLEKTAGACYHCSAKLGDVWEIDHLLPRSKGGRHTFANLVPSCVRCNQDKSDTMPDDWESLGRSPSRRHGEYQSDGSTTTSTTAVIGTPPVVAKEQNQGTHTARVPDSAKAPATARGLVAMAIRATGMSDLNTSHPTFTALVEQGVTAEEFQGAAQEAVKKGKGFGYMLAIVTGRRREAANLGQLPPAKADPMTDPDGRARIEADGIALGLGPWVAFDSATGKSTPWPTYAARVKAKRGDAPPVAASNITALVSQGLAMKGA